MTTIVIANKKGGVAKTTLALNIAVAFAALGRRVGLIDMDPQGHISVSLDMVDDYGRPAEGVFQLMVNGVAMEKVIRPAPRDEYESIVRVPGGEVIVLPGGAKTQLAAVNIQLEGGNYDALAGAIAPLKQMCDVIVMDTAPSNSLFTGGIYNAADWVLIPTLLTRLGVDSVAETVQEMANLKNLHRARLMGIVPTMMQPRTREERLRLEELKSVYQELVWDDVGIRYSVVWREASEAARSIFSYQKPKDRLAKRQAENQMWALVEKIGVAVHG
ncbi:MAG: ParA family protein [Anaerolineae bacterium]|nr:ParA family protein [Anaerolineae bacterium]